MPHFVERSDLIEIPKGTGTEGFVRALRAILQQPRVQEIHINSKGQVEYVRLVRPDEQMQPLAIDFDTIRPYAIVRNGEVKEVRVPEDNAAIAISMLFRQVTMDRFYPVAFIAGANTELWRWYTRTTDLELPATDEFYGLPFFWDRQLEDETLILAAATARGAALIDVQRGYKISIPKGTP